MAYRHMSDIVRNQNPLTMPARTTVKEACAAMRTRHVGAVLVTEASDRLAGIFTGRDAVRCIAHHLDPVGTKLDEIMTPGPKTVSPELLASAALEVINSSSITALFVVENGRPVGIIHIHDLLRAGVV